MHRGRHIVAALAVGGCISATVGAGSSNTPRAVNPALRDGKTASSPKSENAKAAGQTRLAPTLAATATPRAVFDKYCITCHNQRLHTAGLALDSLDVANRSQCRGVGESHREAARRLDAAARKAAARCGHLSRRGERRSKREIDRAWAANPNPGRIGAVHRLNRAEYNNAIRDLFALDLDVKPLLPGDETADGSFDNFADVLSISTAHLERYMSVARQVTRLATGLPPTSPTHRDDSRFRCT